MAGAARFRAQDDRAHLRGTRDRRRIGRELFTVVDTTAVGTPDTMRWLERASGTAITSRTFPAVQRIVAKYTTEQTDLRSVEH